MYCLLPLTRPSPASLLRCSTGLSSACQDSEVLRQAAVLLDELVAYVQRNDVASWEQHADMAGEMAELLREKLSLLDASRAAPAHRGV